MRRAIVEGEPGIFPAPIAQFFVRVNRCVRRRLGREDRQRDDQRDDPPGHPPRQ